MANQTITLGGGCFWCTEAVFEQVEACRRSNPATAAASSQPQLRAGVQRQHRPRRGGARDLRPERITLRELLEIFFTTTTRRRSTARAPTSARSTARASTSRRGAARDGTRGASKRPMARTAAESSPSCSRSTAFRAPRTTTRSTSPRTRARVIAAPWSRRKLRSSARPSRRGSRPDSACRSSRESGCCCRRVALVRRVRCRATSLDARRCAKPPSGWPQGATKTSAGMVALLKEESSSNAPTAGASFSSLYL